MMALKLGTPRFSYLFTVMPRQTGIFIIFCFCYQQSISFVTYKNSAAFRLQLTAGLFVEVGIVFASCSVLGSRPPSACGTLWLALMSTAGDVPQSIAFEYPAPSQRVWCRSHCIEEEMSTKLSHLLKIT